MRGCLAGCLLPDFFLQACLHECLDPLREGRYQDAWKSVKDPENTLGVVRYGAGMVRRWGLFARYWQGTRSLLHVRFSFPRALMTAQRLRRWVAALAALAGTVWLIAWAGHLAAEREAESQAEAVRRSLEVYALSLRSAAANYNYLPFTASQHPEVLAALEAPGDPVRIAQANAYLEGISRRAGSDALYLMAPSGKTLAASNWNTAQSFVGHNYSNRPYFTAARAGNSGLFYGIGATTGIPGLFMGAPVRHLGGVVGVVAVKVSLREIEAAWGPARDPVMLADARGIFFLGSVAPWMFHATRPLAAQDLQEIRASQQYGKIDSFPPVPWTLERVVNQPWYRVQALVKERNVRYMALDEPLPELGWTLTVMTDHAPVDGARNVVWTIGTLGASVLLLAALFARARLRRLADRAQAQHEREEVQQQRLREQSEARRELELRVRERTADLQEAGAFRKAMEDSLLVGMRARDLQGRIQYVNPALCTITGYRAEELIGCLPPYPYWHPEDLAKHWEESNAALEGKAALTGFESRIRHRDGHDVHTMVYTAPLIDGAGRHAGWMSSVVDITAQKQAEAQQALQDLKLQHAGRLTSMGEMASTLAHELNQPLQALMGFTSAARNFARQKNQGLLEESLDDAQEEVKRAGEIIRRVLVLGAFKTKGMEPCAMGEIVTEVLALLRSAIRAHGTHVTTRITDQLPVVQGDRVLLQQVLLNLVTNAIQAMADTPPAERQLEIDVRLEQQVLLVAVADHGVGLTKDVAAQLFEPFFTTKANGLGLGLNICRTIMESHRGSLSVASRPGGGAVFFLQLPLTP